MNRSLFSFGFLFCSVLGITCQAIGRDTDATLAAISTVSSVGELAKQTKLRSGGWSVQLGIGESDGELPWKIIYCLASANGKQRAPNFRGQLHGELLGPVMVEVKSPNGPNVAESLAAISQIASADQTTYATIIPAAWQGDYVIEVRDLDGILIAKQTISVDTDHPCYWQAFTTAPRRLLKVGEPDGDVAKDAVAAIPGLNVSKRIDLGEISADSTLPGQFSASDKPALKLSLSKGVLQIKSKQQMIDWVDRHLLARWWVNGQPLLPKRVEGSKLIQVGRQVTYSDEFRIRMQLRKYFGQLKSTDEISVQVMYCPSPFQELPKTRGLNELEQMVEMGSAEGDSILLSNKLTFKVGEFE